MIRVNRIFISGNCTFKDFKQFEWGCVLNMGIAFNESYLENGRSYEVSHFFDCVAFGGVAKYIHEAIKVGDGVFVQGRLKMDKYKDKNGKESKSIKILIDNIQVDNKGKMQVDNKKKMNDGIEVSMPIGGKV